MEHSLEFARISQGRCVNFEVVVRLTGFLGSLLPREYKVVSAVHRKPRV